MTGLYLGHSKVPVPEPLASGTVWHYTDNSGFLGVVENKCLWASSPDVLNDTSEVRYGEEVVQSVWSDMRQAVESEVSVHLLDKALDGDLRDSLANSVFIVSASSDPDLLNQWAHYGGVSGYALGLDPSCDLTYKGSEIGIETPIDEIPIVPLWHKVIYEREKQVGVARELLRFLVDYAELNSTMESHRGFLVQYRFFLRSIMLQMKHSAFSAEREVRYIVQIPNGESPLFRASASRLIPYVEVRPGRNPFLKDGKRDLITAVKLGPNAQPSAEVVVDRILCANGFSGVDITRSDIPYLSSRG